MSIAGHHHRQKEKTRMKDEVPCRGRERGYNAIKRAFEHKEETDRSSMN